jgi:hypothetical protein
MNKSFLERMLSPEQVQAHRQHLKDVMEPAKPDQDEGPALKIKALAVHRGLERRRPGKYNLTGVQDFIRENQLLSTPPWDIVNLIQRHT